MSRDRNHARVWHIWEAARCSPRWAATHAGGCGESLGRTLVFPGRQCWKALAAHAPASLPTAEAYVGGMLFCLGIFLSFYLLTILLACWENWR